MWLIILILGLLIWNLRELSLSNNQELVECGYNVYITENKIEIKHYINFYILVLIFLIFDLELIMLYLLFSNIFYLNYVLLFIVLYMILIIILGIIYEIKEYNLIYNF